MKTLLRRKIIWGIGAFAAVLISGFLVLITTSLSYDHSNPRDRANSYYITNSVEIDRPVDEVFTFIQYRLPDIFNELTDMHTEFRILNGDKLEVGTKVRCIEGDDNDIVNNLYVVKSVETNKLIHFASTPTIVYSRKTNKEMGRMNVYVYFDFAETSSGGTLLQQTIVLDMMNPFYKSFIDILAFMTGNRGQWSEQFRDELVNFKPIIEREE